MWSLDVKNRVQTMLQNFYFAWFYFNTVDQQSITMAILLRVSTKFCNISRAYFKFEQRIKGRINGQNVTELNAKSNSVS